MVTKKSKEESQAPEVEKQAVYYYAVGRRKEASARIRLYVTPASGEIILNEKHYTKGTLIINDRPIEAYFPGEVAKRKYLEPFRTTNTIGRFITTVRVTGGGLVGQLDAVIHGIARALTTVDRDKFRPILKKRGFLTRDSRIKQRRKAGFAGKARKKKQSPKR